MIEQWREMSAEDRELMVDSSEAVARDYVVNLVAARRGIDPANNGRIHGCDVLGMATALVLAREEVKELRVAHDRLTAECDRLLDKVTKQTVWISEAREERSVFGEDMDRAFLDGFGVCYMETRPDHRFVPLAEMEAAAAGFLAQWHKDQQGEDDDGGEVGNSCEGCGNTIAPSRTHCGALECGGGRLPDIADENTGDRDPAAIDDTWSTP